MDRPALLDMMRRLPRKGFFDVQPRYSCGSPAMVGPNDAGRCAEDELRFYGHATEGVYGEEAAARAKQLGLSGIVQFIPVRSSRSFTMCQQAPSIIPLANRIVFLQVLVGWRNWAPAAGSPLTTARVEAVYVGG